MEREVEFALARDPETVFVEHIAQDVRAARGSAAPCLDGRRPRLFLAGYMGVGNVGAELRVNELIRQIEHLVPGGCEYATLSEGRKPIAGVLRSVSFLPMNEYVPNLLPRLIDQADVVIACEGSTFKSNFSDSLSAMMAGALALGRRTGRCALAYGAEIGAVSERLEGFIRNYVQDSLVMCRTARSKEAGDRIGCRTMLGTDTAWTFAPANTDKELRAAAGGSAYLLICPTNPYWWPVRPDPRRAFRNHRSGIDDPFRYAGVYFHEWSEERELRYGLYLRGLADAAAAVARARGLKIAILGMEALDAAACVDLKRLLPEARVIVGADHSVDFTVNLIRSSSFLISSRYHALLLALPAMVQAIGVATDERIGNLYEVERPPVIAASSPSLGRDIVAMAEDIGPKYAESCSGATISAALPRLAEMSRRFTEELSRTYPNLEVRDFAQWKDWLPSLPQAVARFA